MVGFHRSRVVLRSIERVSESLEVPVLSTGSPWKKKVRFMGVEE